MSALLLSVACLTGVVAPAPAVLALAPSAAAHDDHHANVRPESATRVAPRQARGPRAAWSRAVRRVRHAALGAARRAQTQPQTPAARRGPPVLLL